MLFLQVRAMGFKSGLGRETVTTALQAACCLAIIKASGRGRNSSVVLQVCADDFADGGQRKGLLQQTSLSKQHRGCGMPQAAGQPTAGSVYSSRIGRLGYAV